MGGGDRVAIGCSDGGGEMNYQGIHGVDISTWQDSPLITGHVDFAKMREWGMDFVIIRAGQGNWEDSDFATSWKNAKGILPRASYWFYDNRYPPKEQARKYWETIKYDLEGVCWLDLEDRQTGIYSGWRNWYDFIEELKNLYPAVRVGIYTGFFYWLEYITYATTAQRNYFGQFPLWEAWYSDDPLHPRYESVLVPLPWLEYTILQTGTPDIGAAVGVESKDVDYDQFNGTLYNFFSLFDIKLPMEGVDMYQGKTGMIAKIWDVIGGTQIKELPAGTIVKGDAPAVGYAHLTYPVNGYTKTIWLMNYAPVVVPPPPPPPTPEPTDTITVDVDVTANINGKVYVGTMAGLQLKPQ